MEEISSTDTWRVFVAIELPNEIREELKIHAKRLREMVPQAQASWSRPENIHLTLKFLGDTPGSRIHQLSEAASRTVEFFEPFRIGVGGTGAFPNHREPRVLWIGLSDFQNKLSALHTALEAECARIGFEKEARAFHPHLTIARLRKPQHGRVLAEAHKQMEFKHVEFTVSELLVIRSELSSAGSKYATISRHPLGLK
ncbi:MAG: RNA 2',3'-cyclic phosphodiesterase [Acidobacteriota bacterium]